MRVDLCSGYAFMSQHLLYSPKISPTFHQMSGKRMSYGMWGYILFNACFSSKVFYN